MICKFWFSAKQQALQVNHITEVFINGEWLRYTECNRQPIVSGLWDDYKFLGEADVLMIRVISHLPQFITFGSIK